jgi:hypothetical protein
MVVAAKPISAGTVLAEKDLQSSHGRANKRLPERSRRHSK